MIIFIYDNTSSFDTGFIKPALTIINSHILVFFNKTAAVKDSGKEAEPEAPAVKDPNVPYLQSLRGDNYFIWEYQGRLYVVGSTEAGEYFQKEKQLPAAKTILNAGPNGETLIFEADGNDLLLGNRLAHKFFSDT